MRTPGWYVIQVETGKEPKACEFIRYACELADEAGTQRESILQECFCPTYQHKRKVRGQWVEQETLLLPGYVIAVTRDPWRLLHTLHAVPGFTRLLTMGETFIPLNTDDKQWIERWTTQGNRSIPMSFGYKEGDTCFRFRVNQRNVLPRRVRIRPSLSRPQGTEWRSISIIAERGVR